MGEGNERYTKGRGSSTSVRIRVDLARHDHHPDKKHAAYDPERKDCLPALTYSPISHKIPSYTQPPTTRWREQVLTDIPLLQKRQRIRIRAICPIPKHIRIALVINIRARKQLYRSADDARDEQHEQDEGEQHHGAW